MKVYAWNIMISEVASIMRRYVLPIVFAVFYPYLNTSYKFMPEDIKTATIHTSQCSFCQIAAATEPEQLIYHDEAIVAFYDRKKVAACHIQVIPNRHIPDIFSLTAKDTELVEHMWKTGTKLLHERQPGAVIRVGFHVPPSNSIAHLHMHCIALPIEPAENYLYSNWLWFMSPQECIHMISDSK